MSRKRDTVFGAGARSRTILLLGISVLAADGTAAQEAPVPPTPARPTATAAGPAGASFATEADRRWEGLVRRNSGVVLLKGRWDVGTLEFREEILRWTDARDAGKNLLVPGRQITRQLLACAQSAEPGEDCFEISLMTKDGEYRFRDHTWQQGSSPRVLEVFEFLRAIYPSLASSRVVKAK